MHIQLRNISFAHDSLRPIFEKLSLHFGPGVHAIVGENGLGKSTLLQLIAGKHSVQEGKISLVPSDLEVRLVSQDLEGCSGSEGERRKACLREALQSRCEVLLLDEPTRHLDVQGIESLERDLKSRKGIIVIVSHDEAFLKRVAEHVVVMRRVRKTAEEYSLEVHAFALRWDEAWNELAKIDRAKHGEVARERNERDRLQQDLERKKNLAQERERSRSTKVRMKSIYDRDAKGILAQTKADWASAKASREVGVQARKIAKFAAQTDVFLERDTSNLAIRFAPPKSHNRLLVDFSGRVQTPKGEWLDIKPLWLRSKSRTWIRGRNGAGKSTLLRALWKESNFDRNLAFFLAQEPDAALVREAVSFVREGEREVRGKLGQLLAFLGTKPETMLRSKNPSSGEKKKLLLAWALSREIEWLVLDEPESDFDLPTRRRLKDALCAYPGAITFVTHDRELGDALTNDAENAVVLELPESK